MIKLSQNKIRAVSFAICLGVFSAPSIGNTQEKIQNAQEKLQNLGALLSDVGSFFDQVNSVTQSVNSLTGQGDTSSEGVPMNEEAPYVEEEAPYVEMEQPQVMYEEAPQEAASVTTPQPQMQTNSQKVQRSNSNDGVSQLAYQAEATINSFMRALTSSDSADQAAKAVLPFVHKSLQWPRGKLDGDTRSFQFKKAFASAHFYAHPVLIVRAAELKTTTIGHPSRNTYEKGYDMKYWIARSDGNSAPIVLFFPEAGGKPRVSYMGSL